MPKILLILFCLVGMIFHSQAQTTDDKKIELIFMLDDSGSLGGSAYRIQQQGFLNAYNKIYSQYRNSVTTLSVVYFGSSARISAERVSIDDSAKITTALEESYNGGSTNLTDGLTKVETLLDAVDSNSKPIIILSTDGSPDSKSSAKALADKLIKNDDNDTEFHVSDPDLVSIGIANADLNFLKSISENDVTEAVSIDEFSSKVVELVFGKVAEVVKGLAITAIKVNQVSGSKFDYNVSCEYKGETGEYNAKLTIQPYSTEASQSMSIDDDNDMGTVATTLSAPREGVYTVTCEVTSSDSTRSDTKSKKILAAFDAIVDTDGDGLLDSWEENGVKDRNGNVILPLDELGADKNCVDVFLEVDWVDITYGIESLNIKPYVRGTGKPNKEVLLALSKAFLKGDNENPKICKHGTKTGVRLHIMGGDNYVSAGQINNNLLKYNSSNKIRNWHFANGVTWKFSKFKDADNLIRGLNRRGRLSFDSDKNGIFRYAVVIPYSIGSSGTAYGLPTSTFLAQYSKDDGKMLGTMMHELGHTLGLGHGGSPGKNFMASIGTLGKCENADKNHLLYSYDCHNYKPNHLSVMNYSYQFKGLALDGDLGHYDYARLVSPDLDENHLNEVEGLSKLENDLRAFYNKFNYMPTITYYCDGKLDWLGNPKKIELKNLSSLSELSNIDWDCHVDGNGMDISAFITNEKYGEWSSGSREEDNYEEGNYKKGNYERLKGVPQSEWKSLMFTQTVEGLGVGVVPSVLNAFDEDNFNNPFFKETVVPDFKIDYSFNWNPIFGNVFNLTTGENLLRVSLENTGLKSDSYNISIKNGLFLDAENMTAPRKYMNSKTVTIPAESQKEIIVKVDIPQTTSIGEKLNVTFKAVSQTKTKLVDYEEFQITVVADSDGDGIPDEIENANKPHLDANDPSDGAADPDGDGLTNKDEITLFTDPTTADSIPGLTHDQLTVTSMSFTGINGEGKLSIAGGGNTCKLTSVDFYQKSEELTGQPQAPNGWQFDQGLVGFKAENCDAGATLTVTVDYPQAVAAGSVLKKWGKTATQPFNHWYDVSATTQGKTLSYTVTDGGLGDDDLTADGTIVDPAGIANRSRVNPPVQPAQPVQPVPLDNIFWLLVLVLGGSAWHYRRKLII